MNHFRIGQFRKRKIYKRRAVKDNSFNDKPGAIIGASDGRFGTVRAQFHLRQICVSLNMHIINKQVMITEAPKKFDENGKIIDPKTIEQIEKQLAALKEWVLRLG